MNPTAIYSKSGKGVQEAAGKTSLLARPDRAVLSAIDGRATLVDVAQKVGKAFDAAFQGLITKLDKDGFIREVSPGTVGAAPAAAKPAAKPAPAKAAAPADPASDLDFSSLGASPKPKAAPPPPSRPAAPPPMPAAAPPPPPKEQESALFKARQEAEAKAQAERDRARAEAEAKVKAETEAKLRAEAEAKLRAELEAKSAAEAEAKVKAAREAAARAAAEAKAKADAEAKRAREEADRLRKEAEERERRAKEEAERIRREAEEKAERARREAEEKARREAEELRQRLEEERKAREAAERQAREEADRIRREAEERAERERKALEEERRKLEEELAARRRREEEEEAERRRRREEEDRREAEEREARRRARAEEEAREEEERAAKKARKAPEREPERAPAPKAAGGGFADSLMADLESFNTREEEEAKEKAEAARKADEAAAQAREEQERQRREEEERREREEAKRKAKEEKELQKREEEERLRREEEEEKERIRAEEERRKKEAEERERKAKEEETLARRSQSTAVSDFAEAEKRRNRALARGQRRPEDEALVRRTRRSWSKPIALTLFIVLLAALGVAHVMPIATVDYERAAAEALGRPVRIGSARLWLLTGVQLRMDNVSAGDFKVARVIAHPHLSSLTGPKKGFSLIELEGVSVPQDALGQALFARVKSDTFEVERVAVRKLELPGPLLMPKDLRAELSFKADGTVSLATVRGPEGLVAKLEPKGNTMDFQVEAATFTVPVAPVISLGQFGMKGTASTQGLEIKSWDGTMLDGLVSGTARVRWGGTWNVDGVITARGINAAVFAPALLSEGRGEGTGKFSLSGPEPAKLGSAGRIDGNFTVNKGVLGSFDLSRAIQTSGRQASGRTQFSEMNGQVIYDRGAVTLRNVTIGAGALNAGVSAEIAENGALSGRIVADVRAASQTLRATLSLGGTVKEPQVRN